MHIDFDFDDVQKLAARLGEVSEKTMPLVRSAVRWTAQNVKDDARALARADFGRGHAKRYPYSIDYTLSEDDDGFTAEIGPDKRKAQGALGNILEYGSPTSQAFGQLGTAMEDNEADFIGGLEIAFAQGLL